MRPGGFAGGNWNNGLNYGPFYVNANNHPANSNINRRARLLNDKTFLLFACLDPCPLAKIVATAGASRAPIGAPNALETIKKI